MIEPTNLVLLGLAVLILGTAYLTRKRTITYPKNEKVKIVTAVEKHEFGPYVLFKLKYHTMYHEYAWAYFRSSGNFLYHLDFANELKSTHMDNLVDKIQKLVYSQENVFGNHFWPHISSIEFQGDNFSIK